MEKYELAVRAYSEAVLEMRENGSSLPSLFQVLYDLATRANKLCQAANRSLRRHVVEHEC